MLATLFSTSAKTNTGVLTETGGIIIVSYLIGMFPKVKEYMPTLLMDGNSLIYGISDSQTYTPAIVITVILCVVCFVTSIPVFNKRQI